MAEIAFTTFSIGNVQTTKWTLGGADNGVPWRLSNYQDKFLQINGTFGGATVVLEGTNDFNSADPNQCPSTATWSTLVFAKDGSAISETTAEAGQILDCPLWIRPKTTGGTGSTINVSITAVKGF